MSILNFITDIFKPASDIVDELNVSKEEMGILKNKLEEIKSKVIVQVITLQSKAIDAQKEMELAIQKSGGTLAKSVRPVISIGCFIIIAAMALGFIALETTILSGCFAYLGVYMGLRSFVDKKGDK